MAAKKNTDKLPKMVKTSYKEESNASAIILAVIVIITAILIGYLIGNHFTKIKIENTMNTQIENTQIEKSVPLAKEEPQVEQIIKQPEKLEEEKAAPEINITKEEKEPVINQVDEQEAPAQIEPKSELEAGINIGNLAPDFTLKDLDLEEISLSDYKGENVVIIFWNEECSECIKTIKELERFKTDYNSQTEILSIRTSRKNILPNALKSFLNDMNIQTHTLLDKPINIITSSLNGQVSSKYGVTQIMPVAYFIDKEGIIADVKIGVDDKLSYYSQLEQSFHALS